MEDFMISKLILSFSDQRIYSLANYKKASKQAQDNEMFFTILNFQFVETGQSSEDKKLWHVHS